MPWKTPFENFPALTTDRLILKQMSESDAPAIFKIKSDAESTARYGQNPHKSVEETARWINLALETYREEKDIMWSIFQKGEEVPIGLVTLWNLNADSLMGELGYELNRDYWRHGIMFEALKAVIDWAMGGMDINRIEACPIEENSGSVRILEKLGFKLEGNLRERIHFNGRFWNQLYFGFLKSDWENAEKR